jgi:cytochrome bd-type quinol oxidase subunit 2
MQNQSFDIKADMLQREHMALEAEARSIGERLWWLVGACFVGLAGCIRLFTGGSAAAEFRESFGEFGANGVIWALLIGSVWLLVDFLRGRTIKARSHAVYLELQGHGYAYDFTKRCWKSSAESTG